MSVLVATCYCIYSFFRLYTMYVCVYICSLWYDDIKKFAGGKLYHKTVSIYDHSAVLKAKRVVTTNLETLTIETRQYAAYTSRLYTRTRLQ